MRKQAQAKPLILQIIAISLPKYRHWYNGMYLCMSLPRRGSSPYVSLWEHGDYLCMHVSSNRISKSDPQLLEKVRQALEDTFGNIYP